jgi:phosphate-selective porin
LRWLIASWIVLAGTGPAWSEEPVSKLVEYGPKGLDLKSRDDNYHAHVELRAQFRFTHRDFDGPIAPNPEESASQFAINRARFKLGGHAYRPRLEYYLEYDFVNSWLLDLRFTLRASEGLRLRVGQWKVPYNRERVDSSGKQQFVERSIVTPWFTLDRQQGGALFGRLWKQTRADSWYNLGAFTATGRGGTGSVGQPMVVGRWQWNLLERDLPFSQSDIGYRDKPAASVAVAGAGWRGPFTSFSSSGGGGLPGFPVGGRDTYEVRQAVLETAYQGRGLSWQQEMHWKTVDDTERDTVTDMTGWYAQLGFFFHTLFPAFPKALEIGLRWAEVDPDTTTGGDLEQETTLVFNWFFSGHRNKLTLDLGRLKRQGADIGRRREDRVRLQWDVSF